MFLSPPHDVFLSPLHDVLLSSLFPRWLSLPSQCDQATMSLSSSACPMMLCVRDHLLSLQQLLCGPLFQTAWQGLADRLNNFLYQDVSGPLPRLSGLSRMLSDVIRCYQMLSEGR